MALGLPDWAATNKTGSANDGTTGWFGRNGALRGRLSLLVHGTGMGMHGRGEWQVRGLGSCRRCEWRKGHLAAEPAAGVSGSWSSLRP